MVMSMVTNDLIGKRRRAALPGRRCSGPTGLSARGFPERLVAGRLNGDAAFASGVYGTPVHSAWEDNGRSRNFVCTMTALPAVTRE
jgi:hypothetical protein